MKIWTRRVIVTEKADAFKRYGMKQIHTGGTRMNNNYTRKDIVKFIIPSLIGVLFFVFPIKSDGNWTILYGICADKLGELVAPVINEILLAVVCISAVISLWATITKPSLITKHPLLNDIFITKKFDLFIRIVGAVFGICVYTKLGPEMIWGEATGGTSWGIVTTIMTWFVFGVVLMPLLTDFGLMDFTGYIFSKFTRTLFTLPGRSTVDLLASWIGCNTTGTILTARQYQNGFYTAREAVTIMSCFSAVSISYSLTIASTCGLKHIFFPLYLCLSFAGIVASIICPRIYPLSHIPDSYYTGEPRYSEKVPENVSLFGHAFTKGIERAKKAPSLKELLKLGLSSYLTIVFTLMPLVIAVGTFALIISEHTPFFTIISTPMGYFLQFLGIEGAFAAAPASIIGFADMFLPAVLLNGISFERTRFILCGVSLMQVIFMTETGSLILQSKAPINIWKLILIFLERTIVGLIVMTLLAGLFY